MPNTSVLLSVVVPVVWNRPEQIKRCISSIFSMRQKKIELVIIDQGNLDCVRQTLNLWKKRQIIYKQVIFTNKSKALNLGTKLATADIVAYTDQDCIVDKNWADKILNSFKQHSEVAAVTGKVVPYLRTRVKGKICPTVFIKPNSFLITQPAFHYHNIGIGSNFSFRKNVFRKIGGFTEWLGPGSRGQAAEDAEMLLRLLIRGNKIWFAHEAVVYHDKWLDTAELRKLLNQYATGGMACYGYLYFQRRLFAKTIIYEDLRDSLISCLSHFRNLKIALLKESLEFALSRLSGLCLGFYHAGYDSFFGSQLVQKKPEVK